MRGLYQQRFLCVRKCRRQHTHTKTNTLSTIDFAGHSNVTSVVVVVVVVVIVVVVVVVVVVVTVVVVVRYEGLRYPGYFGFLKNFLSRFSCSAAVPKSDGKHDDFSSLFCHRIF